MPATDAANDLHDVDLRTEESDEDDDSTSSLDDETVEQSWWDRLMSTLLCRGDLASEKLEAPPVSYIQLFRFSTTSDKLCVILGILLSCLVGAIQPIVALIGGKICNVFLIHKHDLIGNDAFWDDAYSLIWGYLLFGGAIFIVAIIQNYILQRGCQNIIDSIRREFLCAVLRQDAAWFDRHDAGTITSQLNENIDRIQDGMGEKIGLITRGISMFISATIFCLFIDWAVTLIVFATGPISALIMGLMARAQKSSNECVLSASSDANALAEEILMNTKTVAACNGERQMLDRYSCRLDAIVGPTAKAFFIEGVFVGMMFFVYYCVMAVALWYGVWGHFNGLVETPGSVIIVTNTVGLGAYFLGLLGPHLMCVLKARVAAAVIYKTIDTKHSDDVPGETFDVKGRLEFRDVQFRYPTRRKRVLKGVSWVAQPGETIAFVGESGCGKSTSIGLLTRLYDSFTGEVLLDERDIRRVDKRWLRSCIGYVQQEPCLFHGTIRDNIRLGRPISDEKIEAAARVANAHDFIQQLEQGYSTPIGTGGVSLSGGQKQRIAIARAIAGEPKLLLLDEATSALDTTSEAVVQSALQRASIGRTTVVIAHRLITLKHVDTIHVIKKGRIVQTGTFEDLLRVPGPFQTMAKCQRLDMESTRTPSGPLEDSFSEREPVIRKRTKEVLTTKEKRKSVTGSIDYPTNLFTKRSRESRLAKEIKCFWNGSLSRFYRSAKGSNHIVAATFVSSLLRGLELPLLTVVLLIAFIALEKSADDYQAPMWISIGISILSGFSCWLFLFLETFLSGWSSIRVVNNIRRKVMGSLIYRNQAYFDQPENSPEKAISTLAQEAPNSQAALDFRMQLIVESVSALVAIIALAFTFCWPNGITTLCTILVLIFTFILLTIFTQKNLQRLAEVDKTSELAIEVFENARTIQLLTVEGYFQEKYAAAQRMGDRYNRKITCYQSLSFAITQSVIFFSDFCSACIGVSLIYHGQFNASDVSISMSCVTLSAWAVIFGSSGFNDVIRASSACQQLFALIGEEREAEQIAVEEKETFHGSVDVRNVSFAYPTRPHLKVSDCLSLSAPAHHSIALVGESGCGKSTIISLLERYYECEKGRIDLDSHSISSLPLSQLRRQIALVGQEPVLFRGSIFENVALGVDGATLSDVQTACRAANAARFIEQMPLGYDTDVGEKGRQLSGGQKQRIAIARALIRKPKVLLLDEATSALDTESEQIVQSALSSAAEGRTTISIAHRLSTIQHSHNIYYIENGRVAESGTHSELLSLGGRYAALCRSQELHSK